MTARVADAILSATLETIVEAVITEDKVTLMGFGMFEKRDRASHGGRKLGDRGDQCARGKRGEIVQGEGRWGLGSFHTCSRYS